ncbi:hypothetical protein ACIHDR_26995 [Nocardia sp. NPDC052278]|uniref:hypothetical protein n=1 Tax=unclassified Nocardia TaxID=2637762 RepID=UPI0036769E81
MTEYAGLSQLSPVVNSMTMLIDRHADRYAGEITEYFQQADGGSEQPLLDSLNTHVETLELDYDPVKISQPGDSLVFSHIYSAAQEPVTDADGRLRALTALLAAEVEFRGPRRLSRTQNIRIAEIYEHLGRALIAAELPQHAVLAFKRAVGLHRVEEDFEAQDRCGHALAQARCRAVYPVWKRIPHWTLEVLCGYGFRPFRLLCWIAAVLLIGTVVLWATDGQPILTALHMCLINYLNPLGLGDLEDIRGSGRTLLIIEAYAGLVLNSLFFALLVRRWFRI